MSSFREELTTLINTQCAENASNTPDFILAQFLESCLDAFGTATNRRSVWVGERKKDGYKVKG